MTSPPRQSAVRTAAAGLIGNVLEWFDFAVYGYFAVAIGDLYFPSDSAGASTLKAYGVLLLGFAARPIGSIVLGLVGDRIGRRALLTVSILLMGIATLGIGLLPTYNTIGIAAPILLVVFRMMQGFSLGGEFTGSMVYTTELASPLMRGIVSSSTAAGVTLGFILGSATAWVIGATMDPVDAAQWGWRIPFLASVSFVILGWFLRRGIHETEHGLKAASERPPVLASLIADWKPFVQTFGIVAMTNAAYYLAFQFALDLRKKAPGAASASDFQLVTTIALFIVLFAKPLGGWLSDRVGRRRLMIALQLLGMAAIYPAVHIMLGGSPWEFFLGQAMLAVPMGMALGLQGAMLVEIFPLRTRVTSMSMSYSIALAASGGAAPLISSWLVKTWGDPYLPVYFVLTYGVLGLLLMVPMRETNDRSLD